jgi:hypothetical protein
MTGRAGKRWIAALALAPSAWIAQQALAAVASTPAGGLKVAPAIVEHLATPGGIGAVLIANTGTAPLKVTVAARPWVQSSAGPVTPNPRATLASLVSISASSFTLAADSSRTIGLTLRRRPPGGSLYGSIDIVGQATNAPQGSGVSLGYELTSSLRLDASARSRRLRLAGGRFQVEGGRKGAALLAVRNTGNTIDPVSGSAQIRGPGSLLKSHIAGVEILPGDTVNLVVATLDGGLPPGHYVATVKLAQGGRTIATVKRQFRLH